jgi:hypothetical protein
MPFEKKKKTTRLSKNIRYYYVEFLDHLLPNPENVAG